jgi:hypothetical protein
MAFDLSVALDLGAFTQAAYSLYVGGDPALIFSPGYTVVENLYWAEVLDDEPSVCGFIARLGNDITVALRGTKNAAEIARDVVFFFNDFPYAKAGSTERGFTALYGTLRIGKGETDMRAVDRLRVLLADPLITSLRITGHSLGAAVATMLALDLAVNAASAPPALVYTFASPRVGDKVFAGVYDAMVHNTYRICNLPDWIPNEPPSWYGYAHVDAEVPINSGTSVANSIACRHALATYLHTLDPKQPLGATCGV